MIPSYDESVALLLNILSDMGTPVQGEDRLLDFGCGSGALVKSFLSRGIDAHGVDIRKFWDDADPQLDKRLDVIDETEYRFPYPNESFDFVCSTSVFEHVLDYERSFREIHRVLKPGGVSMHQFPGPWVMPVEPHIFVPLASMIQTRTWFRLWAFLGIRNSFQKNMHWNEVAERNYQYSQTGIHYLPRNIVREMVIGIFGNVSYPSKSYLQHSPGGAARLGRTIGRYLLIPFYDKLLFSLREQVIYSVKT